MMTLSGNAVSTTIAKSQKNVLYPRRSIIPGEICKHSYSSQLQLLSHLHDFKDCHDFNVAISLVRNVDTSEAVSREKWNHLVYIFLELI